MHYWVGEAHIDARGFELRRNGQIVPVEPRVLEFVLYLIQHRDRMVPKHELLHALWKDSCVVEAVITRCAHLARRSLGDPKAIRTVRGRGYRWVAHTRVAGGEMSRASIARSKLAPGGRVLREEQELRDCVIR
jgi:DNA-binding winged helix-turn-helix (wHTH) protein